MAYKRIVVGTDGSDSATEAVRHAARLAAAFGADLVILTAFHPPDPAQVARWIQEAPRDIAPLFSGTSAAEEVAEKAVQVAVAEGAKAEASFTEGDPADTIVDSAENVGADLVIVGNKGMTGVKRFLLGSVPDKVTHHAPCDVLIVHTT